MSKLCVITNRSLADGFRLAGVEVYAADTAEMARSALSSLIRDEDVGMVAIDADFYNALDSRTRARLESRYKPVVIAIPAPTRMVPGERRSRYISDLIQRAIGLKITVKGQ